MVGRMAETLEGPAFADAFVPEGDAMAVAREAADQFGISGISPATGVALALAVATGSARSIFEIGTGTGVSGLWLLSGSSEAQLTSIDADFDVHQVARSVFVAAGVPPRRVRLIHGRALDLLPRMNEQAYDLVFIDADAASAGQYLEAGLRLVRRGGSVFVHDVLQGGLVADARVRDPDTTAYRNLLVAVRDRDDVLAGISPVGGGLLHVLRRH